MSSDNKELIHLTGIEKTKEWFEQAIPEPTIETTCVQIGCHFEEVAEMMEALGLYCHAENMHQLANKFKRKILGAMVQTTKADLIKLADSIGDQCVTGCGVLHNYKVDAIGVLNEVNRSNFSKFEDGKPVFDSNGKITKGKNYTPPDLTPYI